ncbi:MAG: metal-sulfur cluster assembly factor [Proteobacteria bacterium]|nr:metal-sulfur cluster assembly factor [Pseudomonadota bacterium]
MANNAPVPDVGSLRDALREVIDPEAGMNIVDLGLIYRIEITAETVLVEMTMTSPACPMGEMITAEVAAVLRDLLPINLRPEVRLVWSPAWDPSRMSQEARRHFGW